MVGGVCINTGTIPSKTMREAVLHLSGYNYRSVYGINYRVKEKITMADLAFRVQAVIKTEVDVTEAQLSRNGIDVVHGIAHFVDPTPVRVEGPQSETTLEADRVIIAVGTKPASSPKVPINGRTIVNSDQILDLPALPRSLIVVGGGVIGVEYACMFAMLGVRVTHHRKARPAARVRRPRDHRGAQLSPARQPRDAAAGRRGGERGRAA